MRTAVIGAGMTGLITALRLSQAGEAVTVFERDTVPGGLAAGFRPGTDGAHLERFYHHVFRTDVRFVALCEELGIGDALRFSKPQTSCFREGRLQRLDSAIALLRFRGLPLRDRVRLALALGLLKLAPGAARFEDALAAAWLRRFAGRRAYAAIFEPLFRAKFGAHAEAISLAWFWARIHDRTPELGYVNGGFAVLYETLAARVVAAGGKIVYGFDVASIACVGERFVVNGTGTPDPAGTFERVVATCALERLAEICAALPAAFVRAYTAGGALAARCLILALDRPLTGTYWINICEPDWPFLVVVEQTALVPAAVYGGRHLVYVGNYGGPFPRVDAATLARAFAPYLRRLNPAFDESWVTDRWQFVASDAQPIVTPSYRARIPPQATPVPGLYLANLAQVYPHDRGQNYAIDLAERVVALVRRDDRAAARP